jgi:hypothetical protein
MIPAITRIAALATSVDLRLAQAMTAALLLPEFVSRRMAQTRCWNPMFELPAEFVIARSRALPYLSVVV